MQRKVYLDYLKIISVLAVIIIHVTGVFYSNPVIFGSFQWWGLNISGNFCRFAVALFVCVSGALLLSKSLSIKDFYLNRLSRIFIPFIFWILCYLLVRQYFQYESDAVDKFFRMDLYTKASSYTHLWFLPMYISLMIFAPFIAFWVNQKEWGITICYGFACAVMFFMSLLWLSNILNEIYGIKIDWIGYFIVYLGYFILGFYLDKYSDLIKISNTFLVITFLVVVAINSFGNFFLYKDFGVAKDYLFADSPSPLIFIMVVTLFLLAKKNSQLLPEKKWVRSLSDASFGIYLIHPLFLFVLLAYVRWDFSSNFILLVLLVFILSYVAILAIKKIPFLKRVC